MNGLLWETGENEAIELRDRDAKRYGGNQLGASPLFLPRGNRSGENAGPDVRVLENHKKSSCGCLSPGAWVLSHRILPGIRKSDTLAGVISL